MTFLIIGFIPLSAIILFFVKDAKPVRQRNMRIFLIANLLLFVSPLVYAFVASLPDGNMWSDNGAGAAMWAYLIIGPLCFLIQVALLIFKLRFARSSSRMGPYPIGQE